jgi:tetratricopeptide (TPR) repeat protein
MHRRPARVFVCTAIVAALFMLTTTSRLAAQSSAYADSYRFRNTTTVGFVPTTGGFGWGVYPYRATRVAPAGEFGGYLYRSPDDFLNFRGPEYVPVANAAVGMPVANASGRVPLDNVPMWTDEWAARIVQNRAAAGIDVDVLATARTPRPAAQPTPVELQQTPAQMSETTTYAIAPNQPNGYVPVIPAQPKREEPALPAPVTRESDVESTSRINPNKVAAAVPTEVDTAANSLVLGAEDAVTSPPSPPEVTAIADVASDPPATSSADESRVMNQEDAATDASRPKTLDSMMKEYEESIRQIETAAREWETAANTQIAPAAPEIDVIETTAAPTAPTTSSTPELIRNSEPETVNATVPALTSDDLNRATAAGIAIGRGDKAFEQGDYAQARNEYLHAIESVGDEPGIRIALGLSDYALGSFSDSARAIKRGVSRSPELARSEFHLLDVYGRLTDAELHRRALDNYVSQHPEDSDALFVLGFVQYFSDQRHSARTTFGAYRSIVPHDELADPFIDIVMDYHDASGEKNPSKSRQ